MNSKLLARISELEERGSLVKTEGSAVERFATLLTLAAISPEDAAVKRFNAILSEFNQHQVGGVVVESLKLKHSGESQQVAKLALVVAVDG